MSKDRTNVIKPLQSQNKKKNTKSTVDLELQEENLNIFLICDVDDY